MGNDLRVPSVEIGRVVFRSWEHVWLTDEKQASSVATAKRLLPDDITRPIYEILERWERDILRSSLPFSPYGIRVRRANNEWMAFENGDYHLLEIGRRSLCIRELCPTWDEALPQSKKPTNYRQLLSVPSGDTQVIYAYEVMWQPVAFPATVYLDQLLRDFSPRYKEPTIFR